VTSNLIALQGYAKQSKTVAVIKANAYGNGAVKIAQHIQAHCDMFAVAILQEALELRASGITLPILVLQGPHESPEVAHTLEQNLHWMIHNHTQLGFLDALSSTEASLDGRLWFKFDSGMHRLGFALDSFAKLVDDYPQYFTPNTVIATHLACADEANSEHAQSQIDAFLKCAQTSGFARSIANSAGTIAHKDARQDFNRIGIAMYGSSPFSVQAPANQALVLKPVMHLQAKIIALRTIPKGDTVGYGATWKAPRQSTIATVAIGYADGYPRHAPTGTPAMCNGHRIALVGRVSMDMITFDVTDLQNVEVGDDVELWGDTLSINDVAEHIGTIGYELMTRLSSRVTRRYFCAAGNDTSPL
jgi:alanine racemase